MKKQNWIILGIAIILLFGIGYKVFWLFYYKIDDESIKEVFDHISEINITNNANSQNTKIEQMHISIPKNYQEDTSAPKEKQKDFYLKKDGEAWSVKISLSFKEDYLESIFSENPRTKNFNYQKILEKNEINDAIDLLRYYEKQKKEKPNILWSKSKVQMNYMAKYYALMPSPITKHSYFLTKDIKGYMVENDPSTIFDALLIHEEKTYFVNAVVTEENALTHQDFINLLESVYFE